MNTHNLGMSLFRNDCRVFHAASDGSPCESYVLKVHNAHESALEPWIEVRHSVIS